MPFLDSTRTSAQNSTTSAQLDLAHIEALAHNNLARALRELRSDEPDYRLIAKQIGVTLAAVRTLDMAKTFMVGGA